jgi:hypothetical protein
MALGWVFLALTAAWVLLMGTYFWREARGWGVPSSELWRLILRGLVDPVRFWYCERPLHWPAEIREKWLRAMAQRLGLNDVRAAHCPLCGSEIPNAWDVDHRGRLTVGPGPVRCPQCDFRLDACRHCRYFQPAGASSGGAWSGIGMSWTHGRCTFYKSVQPVEEIVTADMARRMRERGYTHLRAPTPIADSYIPLDMCNAFVLELNFLPHSGMRKPGRRQRLALWVLAAAQTPQLTRVPAEGEGPLPGDEEQWLL